MLRKIKAQTGVSHKAGAERLKKRAARRQAESVQEVCLRIRLLFLLLFYATLGASSLFSTGWMNSLMMNSLISAVSFSAPSLSLAEVST